MSAIVSSLLSSSSQYLTLKRPSHLGSIKRRDKQRRVYNGCKMECLTKKRERKIHALECSRLSYSRKIGIFSASFAMAASWFTYGTHLVEARQAQARLAPSMFVNTWIFVVMPRWRRLLFFLIGSVIWIMFRDWDIKV